MAPRPVGIERRSAVLAVAAVVACTGAVVLGVAWAVGAGGWLVADLPGASNDVRRELALAFCGAAFLLMALAGAVVSIGPRGGAARQRPPARRVLGAVVVSVLALLVSVVGAGRFAGAAMAQALRPVLDDGDVLNSPAGDGRALLAVGLLLAAAALATVVPRSAGRVP